MSVNVNLKPASNTSKWESIKSSDFAILEGTSEHPIPNGLYRIFIIIDQESSQRNIFIIPLFDGPFENSMFPYLLNNSPPPTISQKISKLNIDIEI